MSEMIDRMVAAARRHMAETGADFSSVDEGLAGIARAMLTEAREPTKGMLDAVDPRKERMMGCGYSWQAMCDEALAMTVICTAIYGGCGQKHPSWAEWQKCAACEFMFRRRVG